LFFTVSFIELFGTKSGFPIFENLHK